MSQEVDELKSAESLLISVKYGNLIEIDL